jgi:tetratricopeptide (TPR) repeat protein
MNRIFIFEDHDQSLTIWKKYKVRGLDLVHVDAHIDFGLPDAEDIATIVTQANSIKELKARLETSIAFQKYEDDFSKLINIGNYIYPAMRDGLVRDLYWVVPGDKKEFAASLAFIVSLLKAILRQHCRTPEVSVDAQGRVVAAFGRKKICVCPLDAMPRFSAPALLDIDTDFLVIDSVRRGNNTAQIAQRRPWIAPQELARMLKRKVARPFVITIAYSSNGGFTPLVWRYLGDELAYCFDPGRFARQYRQSCAAAQSFTRFRERGSKNDYWQAVRSNPIFRMPDNNYGPLYLGIRKLSLAQKEFARIIKADAHHPGALFGLGLLSLERKRYRQARKYFMRVLASKSGRMFSEQRKRSLLGLAEAEYGLHHNKAAKKLLLRSLRAEKLEPQSRFLLGKILEQDKDYPGALRRYQESIQLGLLSFDILCRLAKISLRLREKKSIIDYIARKYKGIRLDKTVLRKNRDMVHRKIAGETILLPVYRSSDEINCIYTLNDAAAWVWDRIDERRTLADIQKQARHSFGAQPTEIERKLNKLIKELKEIKALV